MKKTKVIKARDAFDAMTLKLALEKIKKLEKKVESLERTYEERELIRSMNEQLKEKVASLEAEIAEATYGEGI
jgi:phage shock protein A